MLRDRSQSSEHYGALGAGAHGCADGAGGAEAGRGPARSAGGKSHAGGQPAVEAAYGCDLAHWQCQQPHIVLLSWEWAVRARACACSCAIGQPLCKRNARLAHESYTGTGTVQGHATPDGKSWRSGKTVNSGKHKVVARTDSVERLLCRSVFLAVRWQSHQTLASRWSWAPTVGSVYRCLKTCRPAFTRVPRFTHCCRGLPV